jgi:hypothetical protein
MKQKNYSAKVKVVFRPANLDDVSALVKLEQEVWKENAANRDQIISRINTFPAGNIIALVENLIVGYIAFEYVGDMMSCPNFSWAEITDHGTIAASHKPEGDYVYGLNLSVHYSMNGQGLGTGLALQVWINMIKYNKKGAFMGSRIPYYAGYLRHHPKTPVEDYVKLKRNGHLFDPELHLYSKDGLLPVKVLPNYFPDPPSLDYGVLLYRRNPVYGWPLKRFWAWLISKVPLSVRSSIAINKEGPD